MKNDEGEWIAIPEGGWTEKHDGDFVRLQLPLGTVIKDEIISIPIQGGEMIYGPSSEIGGVMARAQFSIQAQMAAAEYASNIEKQTEDWE